MLNPIQNYGAGAVAATNPVYQPPSVATLGNANPVGAANFDRLMQTNATAPAATANGAGNSPIPRDLLAQLVTLLQQLLSSLGGAGGAGAAGGAGNAGTIGGAGGAGIGGAGGAGGAGNIGGAGGAGGAGNIGGAGGAGGAGNIIGGAGGAGGAGNIIGGAGGAGGAGNISGAGGADNCAGTGTVAGGTPGPVGQAPAAQAPAAQAPAAQAPVAQAPVAQAPVAQAPKPEAPKPEAPKPEAPKPEAPKPEAPKAEEKKPEEKKPEEKKDEGINPFNFLCKMILGSPVALDTNGDGAIGTTGDSTAKERAAGSQLGNTVQFDLDGNGSKENVEWMSGDGDSLLIDNRDGNAASDMSGKRLFGDLGGQYNNGYERMAELDSNKDGKLAGAELQGLNLWVDNGNAQVDQGEIKSLADFGVTELNVNKQDVQNARGESLMQSSATKADGSKMLTEDVWFGKAA